MSMEIGTEQQFQVGNRLIAKSYVWDGDAEVIVPGRIYTVSAVPDIGWYLLAEVEEWNRDFEVRGYNFELDGNL